MNFEEIWGFAFWNTANIFIEKHTKKSLALRKLQTEKGALASMNVVFPTRNLIPKWLKKLSRSNFQRHRFCLLLFPLAQLFKMVKIGVWKFPVSKFMQILFYIHNPLAPLIFTPSMYFTGWNHTPSHLMFCCIRQASLLERKKTLKVLLYNKKFRSYWIYRTSFIFLAGQYWHGKKSTAVLK